MNNFGDISDWGGQLLAPEYFSLFDLSFSYSFFGADV